MTTIAFVLWLLGWPVVCEITRIVDEFTKFELPQEARNDVHKLELVIWFGVAALLWFNR